MIAKIKEFFENKMILDKQSENQIERIPIAACALLLEMAHTDAELSDIEEKKIISIMQEEFKLDKTAANDLIKLAMLERNESLDLWQFTNLINQHYSKEEKTKLLEILWYVVYADGKVDQYEEYLMRRLNYLLNMDHKDMIEAKFRARERK